jgi:hypothetical protein
MHRADDQTSGMAGQQLGHSTASSLRSNPPSLDFNGADSSIREAESRGETRILDGIAFRRCGQGQIRPRYEVCCGERGA